MSLLQRFAKLSEHYRLVSDAINIDDNSTSADAPGSQFGGNRLLVHASIFIALVLAWEIGSRVGWLDPLFFPKPTDILASIFRIYITQGNVWFHLYASLGLVFAGFIAGSILGVVLGSLVGFSAVIRRFIKPYVIVLEATPRIAVAPLLIALTKKSSSCLSHWAHPNSRFSQNWCCQIRFR